MAVASSIRLREMAFKPTLLMVGLLSARVSITSTGSPSILNASPEAAAGGGLAVLRTGDRIRIDLEAGTADILISDQELAQRHAALEKAGGFKYPPSQTPWQEIQRSMVDQLADGMVLKPAVKYRRVAQTSVPRDNH